MSDASAVREQIDAIKRDLERYASQSNASVSISSDGVYALCVALVAIICLVIGGALTFVAWQQSALLERQVSELRSRVNMAEGRERNVDSRIRKLEDLRNER